MHWRLRFKPSIRALASMRTPSRLKSYAIPFSATQFARTKRAAVLTRTHRSSLQLRESFVMPDCADPDDPNRAEAISKATSEVNATKAAVTIPNVPPNREKPWGFWTVPWGGSMEIATAIRPGEIYRVLQELREMSPEEAQLLNIPKELTDKARGLVAALHRLDLPAIESRVKLKDIAAVANMFAPEQQKAVVETLGTFGATVERATTQAYDRFQRWFGSAQDRSEQWFQIHVRMVTIVAAILVSIFLQLDTVEIYDKLRHEPKLVEALVKTAPGTLEQGAAARVSSMPTRGRKHLPI